MQDLRDEIIFVVSNFLKLLCIGVQKQLALRNGGRVII